MILQGPEARVTDDYDEGDALEHLRCQAADWVDACEVAAELLRHEANKTRPPLTLLDADATSKTKVATTSKRSTEKGEGRVKLIAALTKHHQYANGSCLNLEYIGSNILARLAGVSESTSSAFFQKQFGGHTKYRAICRDKTGLIGALKLLNQEFSPFHLYGAKPPGEDDWEDEE